MYQTLSINCDFLEANNRLPSFQGRKNKVFDLFRGIGIRLYLKTYKRVYIPPPWRAAYGW